MKSESLVIADQNGGEYVPGLYTPPVTPWGSLLAPEVGLANCKEGGYHGVADDWGEVVTR